jgi:hypothetical protein
MESDKKRRKLTDVNVFGKIREGIFDTMNSVVQLHWIVLLTALAWRHPSSFSLETLPNIISEMAFISEQYATTSCLPNLFDG